MEIRQAHFEISEFILTDEVPEFDETNFAFEFPKFKDGVLSIPVVFACQKADHDEQQCIFLKTITTYELRGDSIKSDQDIFNDALIDIITEIGWAAYHNFCTTFLIYSSEYETFGGMPYKSQKEIKGWVQTAIASLS